MSRTGTLAVGAVLLGVITLYALWLYAACSPQNGLFSKISGVRSKMADIDRQLSPVIETGQPVPTGFAGKPPCLAEIPADADPWITSANGKSQDDFKDGGRLLFAHLSSGNWILLSYGPDRDQDIGMPELRKWDALGDTALKAQLGAATYDPTNGAISGGDIIRLGSTPFHQNAKGL